MTWNATLRELDLEKVLPRLKQEAGQAFLIFDNHEKGKKNMSDHPICHVEIPALDPTALSAFYAEVFDWQVEAADPARNAHLFHVQRGPGGAFVQAGEATGIQPGQVVIYIFTEDIDATLAKAEERGAKTLTPKTEVPYGWTAAFADPAGNRIALFSTPHA